MSTAKDILKEAIQLEPTEKVKLVDQLITSLDKPDKDIDKLWAEEAESRLDAYKQGKLKAGICTGVPGDRHSYRDGVIN
jgi:putative addiction module component (TIGR02574 family)